MACESGSGVCFFLREEEALSAEHVHAGVEDVSVGGAEDTWDEGREFVEEVDDPAGLGRSFAI